MKKNNYFLFVAATGFLFSVASVEAGEFSFGTGAEYTEGDYGTGSDNSALYVPFTLGYSADVYSWSITVPYLRVTGTGEVVYGRTGVRAPSTTTSSGTGGGGGPGGGSTTTTTTTVAEESTETGIGDVTLSATYRLLDGVEQKPNLAMTAKVKFATADENKNLGTGENDYSLQIEAGLGSVYGYLGYLLIGDTATTDYDDIFFGAVGVSGPVANWTLGGEYYAEQEVLADVDPVSKVTLSAGRELGKDNWLDIYLIKGFTDSTVDWGAGVGITHYF